MTFGKYSGQNIKKIPTDYLIWVTNNFIIRCVAPATKKIYKKTLVAIKQELKNRESNKTITI